MGLFRRKKPKDAPTFSKREIRLLLGEGLLTPKEAVQLSRANKGDSPSSEVKSVEGRALIPIGWNNQPVWSGWDTERAVRDGFKASGWVFTCVTERMDAVASVPMMVQRRRRNTRWEDVRSENDPLVQLLAKPNEFMSWQELVKTIIAHLDLGGNALLGKNRGVTGRLPVVELWGLRPDCIKPVPSRQRYVAGYRYTLDGVPKTIDAKDIIHFRYVDPANSFWGVSPLMAGARTVDMEIEAVKWNKSAMQNRAVPDGMISFRQAINEKQFQAAFDMLEKQMLGPHNARLPFITGGDADYRRFSLTPAEMDYILSRKMTREEICALFGVPPPLVGIYDKATLNNIQTARTIFWEDTIIALLDSVVKVLNFALVPDFDASGNTRIVADTSKVPALQQAYAARVKTAVALWQTGVPINMLNQRFDLGFDDIPGGDVGYVQTNLMPTDGGEFSTDAPMGGEGAQEDEEEEDSDSDAA